MTLPRSDPPYSWGTVIVEIPDSDILQSGTNRVGLPGDGRQKQALRSVTRGEKVEKNAATAGEKTEKNAAMAEEKAEENSAAKEKEKAVKDTEAAAERKAGEVSAAVWEWRAGKTPGPPAAPRDATEDQEAVHQNSGHALGRAWPQQMCGAGLTNSRGDQERDRSS
ncbi:hypothetical protein NDU88_006951 [Pleurodeles waltl]|uniref:Uncharacterized protein n=1 Tax=Pleurodeles waltl TaxID=8319 RepID=A0AAV7N0R6_PLEWA|nr:hypothetical protein NDU88_006951 [Pleurodeles waltl]